MELSPDDLWQSVLKTVRDAIENAGLTAKNISCMGISTQRSTFITWDRNTGETFHNFITWKDLRADSMVRKWNDSITLKVNLSNKKLIGVFFFFLNKMDFFMIQLMHGVSHCLYLFTRNKRFLAGSVLKLMNAQVI